MICLKGGSQPYSHANSELDLTAGVDFDFFSFFFTTTDARLTWPTRLAIPTRIHNLFVRTTTTTPRPHRPTRARPDSLATITTTTTTPTPVRLFLSSHSKLTSIQQPTPPQMLAMAPARMPRPSSPKSVSPMAPPLVTPVKAHIPTPLGPPTSKFQSRWKR